MRVITRASSSTARYASLRRTSASRSGSISSRAVARRMVPSRCTVPEASTYPRGSVNATSVLMCAPAAIALHPLEALVADRHRLHRHLVRAGVHRRARVLGRPRLHQRVRGDRRPVVVDQLQRAVGARGVGALRLDLVAPLPQALVDIDPALELDVRPLDVARDLDDVRVAVGVDLLLLDDLLLGVQAGHLAELPDRLATADLQPEVVGRPRLL